MLSQRRVVPANKIDVIQDETEPPKDEKKPEPPKENTVQNSPLAKMFQKMFQKIVNYTILLSNL